MTPLLEVTNLNIAFPRRDAPALVPVDDVSFSVAPGEVVALVGESGSGKTLTGLSIPQLLPEGASIGGASSIRFAGDELIGLSEKQLRGYRGNRVAMVFQDPMASLNPVMRVGDQIIEAIRAHGGVSRSAARTRAVELLQEVGIADPARRVRDYPHQMSGGMRQRVMIAIALGGEPELLIADEPTTALDVTVQAQILELLDRLRSTRNMSVLLITHDLGIVAGRANRVLVMYAGRIVESASTAELFSRPAHPYTQALFASIPRLDTPAVRLAAIPGAVPRPDQWPTGCRFHPRCPVAVPRCAVERPPFGAIAPGHHVASWVALGEPG